MKQFWSILQIALVSLVVVFLYDRVLKDIISKLLPGSSYDEEYEPEEV